ncbi:GGDEF domain-containing protein [Sporosalibacterium faouarense]|uniref:GGDEF domain-containing protein n=1 Tax=Sporosalibacterium faouarense TaxID=516123 RepID=UPI00192CC6BA|nr:GGDEF domain-containing protein [Sporosalibacterium faouarense]
MINKFLNNNYEEYKVDITSEHINQINDKIKKTNYKRLLIFSILTTVLEVILIIFNDIPVIFKGNGNVFIGKMYLLFHSLILITSSTVLILLRIYKKKRSSKIYNFIAETTVLLGMTCMAFIGALDQITIGQITSYITILIICGIAILIKPPKNYLVYSVPHLIFLYLTFRFQENQNILLDIVVNSTMYYICVLLISKVIYENQVEHIVKNIVLEATNKKLEYISNYDFLTNLFNRRYFEDVIKTKITEDKNYEKKEIAIGVMDIDHFKSVNDKYGHKAGDIVLQEVAKIITENIGDTDLTARWGGEEFIILFADKSIESCETIANKIREEIERNDVLFDNSSICVTASFGLTKFEGNTEKDFSNGFKKADEALYLAKKNGRNRIECLY